MSLNEDTLRMLYEALQKGVLSPEDYACMMQKTLVVSKGTDVSTRDIQRLKARSKLIERLQDISATEYGPLDTERMEDDIHDLAQAVLSILCTAEQEVLQGQHLMDQSTLRCLLCGDTAMVIMRRQQLGEKDLCPGAQL